MVFQDGCAEIFHNSTFWARFGPTKLKMMIFEIFCHFQQVWLAPTRKLKKITIATMFQEKSIRSK